MRSTTSAHRVRFDAASAKRACILACLCAAGCSLSANNFNSAGTRSYQLGQHQVAVDNFRKALNSDPRNADAYYNLAATYHDLGRRQMDKNTLQQAEELYHQCLDLQPDHVDCHRGLAVLLVQTDRAESAFTLLQRWSTRTGRGSDARIELARLYEEFGDTSSAGQQLTEALNLDPRNPRAWTAMGRLREREGQMAQALSNYQQAYNLNRNQPGVADRIATLQRTISTVPATPGTQMVNTPGGLSR